VEAAAGEDHLSVARTVMMITTHPTSRVVGIVMALALLVAVSACRRSTPTPAQPTFASAEAAVSALAQAVKDHKVEDLRALFGPEGQVLADTSDPATARRNREVFTAAMAERWRLDNEGASGTTLVVGNEEWPFPIPLVNGNNRWRFDTAAGVEEVLSRRIGRNELAVLRICAAYVAAQRLYSRTGHDGRRTGLYATKFTSDQGRQNGLYWPARHGDKRSPLGDLVASAAAEGRTLGGTGSEPSPFHGYYYRILTAQGASAPGGAKDYMVNGELEGGFALVAWPAQYDMTGVMTFIVNQDGMIWQKDLGPGTGDAARKMSVYDPDASWTAAR
jgi:hypothetical protein